MSKWLAVAAILCVMCGASAAGAQGAGGQPPPDRGMGFLAAAIVCGVSVVAAGVAVAVVGSAALGAVSEKPEIVGRALLFVGLAEGLGIYGLLVAILILLRL
jgi:V/A-type H+-transporting ATPase subunit K